MARQPLTVIIPCKNEQHNIGDCLDSVRPVADEILLADSGSTDATLEIARLRGVSRVICREYVHSGDFKNWAIPQARCPWVLIVDADERVTEALADEIRRELESPQYDGYWIYRENYFQGHRIRFSGWQNDCCLRLFRRDLGRYVGQTDHAEVEITGGRVGRLRHRLKHYTSWHVLAYLRKLERYAEVQAQVWYEQGRKPSLVKLAAIGPLRFLQTYLLRLGFLDGVPGLQVCALTAFYSFLKQARLWELYYGKKQPLFPHDPQGALSAPKEPGDQSGCHLAHPSKRLPAGSSSCHRGPRQDCGRP
ncbi:MAG: glycosyl transferase [Pirellulaceae bacterium]|nr:MAG: glycosyl transferase [Pirellulaceae bacterium]